ncbi:MAG: hypothetical protein Tsb002_28330 [Wenzhouxiangellaceae bacterium]
MSLRRALLTSALLLSPLLGSATETLNVRAENVTGWNRYLGEVRYQWDFIAPPLDVAGANTMGEYNPSGAEPFGLTAATPGDAVLASLVDPFLEVVFPPFVVELTNPDAVNVPVRETATIVGGDAITRGVLPFIEDASASERSQAAPNSPAAITLDEWFEASGRMRIRCDNHGGAELTIRVRDLIPNRVYTVWAMWHLADGRIFPQPYGGVPNAYITDGRGNALFKRDLNFCPMEASRNGIDGNRLLSIITHIHSDHALYGAVPFPGGAGYPPGSVGSMQLEWNFPGTGIRLID